MRTEAPTASEYPGLQGMSSFPADVLLAENVPPEGMHLKRGQAMLPLLLLI